MGGMIHNSSSTATFQNTIPDEPNPFALFNVNHYPIHYDISKNPQRKVATGINNMVAFNLVNPNTTFPKINGFTFNWTPLTTSYNIESIVPNFFTSNVLAMVLGLNYRKAELQSFVLHKRVILFDFANIVGQLFMFLDGKLHASRESEKIEFIKRTFFNFFNDNENCLYIIVAKPIRNVSIDDIMLEYFKRNPTTERDYFQKKCIVLTTTYFDGLSNTELSITGGSDDYILWLLTISLYNLTKASFGDLRLVTADKQKIFKDLYFRGMLSDRRAPKTILSNTFPSQSDVDTYNSTRKTTYTRENIRIGIYFKDISFSTGAFGTITTSITTTVDQPAIDYLNIIWDLMKREVVSKDGSSFVQLYELPPEHIYPIMESIETIETNEINKIIKKHLKSPPFIPLHYTRYTDNLLPICTPQNIPSMSGTFIMLNTLKMIYYIRLVQVLLFGEEEAALSTKDILDLFQLDFSDDGRLFIGRDGTSPGYFVWDTTKYTLTP